MVIDDKSLRKRGRDAKTMKGAWPREKKIKNEISKRGENDEH